ncbi:MAG TPA: hypothetical protein VNI02_11275 [Blastocatellia bacterium]|jgi:hypothetical protein|nr:hypothetical protein [Blastocatellia bacterium]
MPEATLQTVTRLSSPALRAFESNPFRVLRLATNASTSDGSFQAERVLTLLRAGLSAAEEDVLPWLPSASTYEVQQAAQIVEEPLARLAEQLLWFDFVRDPNAASLKSLLRELTDEALQKYFEQEAGLPMPEKCDPENEAGVSLVAQAINQANVRLLVAASLANGVIITKTAAPVEPGKIARVDWQTLYGLSALPDAHSVIGGSLAGTEAALDGSGYWERALRRWARLLTHPWFRPYLGQCIADLDDDFVSTDDAETIEESIRTRLADLSSHEMRFLLLGGHYPLASGMISALANSELEKRVLVPALRPIHHLFQSEVSELQALLDGTGQDRLSQIDAYLKRLAAIKKRWLKIDEAGLIGLSHILDDALEQAYLRLRNLEKLDTASDGLLVKISQLAAAASLRERVHFFQSELEEARKRLCHFCKTGVPDYEKSVVLEGKRETHRETVGNSTTIYIGIQYGIIMRCERCAFFHDFIWKVGICIMWGLFPALCFLIVPLTGIALILFLGLGAIRADHIVDTAVFVPRLVANFSSYAVARFITPSGYRRYGDHRDTEAWHTLRSEGYSIDVKWKSTAISEIKDRQG